MSQRFVDDATGEIIRDGRSWSIGIYHGEDRPYEARDYTNIDDVMEIIREALTGERPRPPLQIVVQTITHMELTDPRPEWQR